MKPLLACVVKEDLITPEQIISIAKEILVGLDYIHNFDQSLKLIHRDIKPENIFIRATENTFEVKIGDFGIIRKTSGDNSYTMGGARGSLYYMVPEVLKHQNEISGTSIPFNPQVYHQSADTYAVGLTLIFMITGIIPFEGTNTEKIDEKVPCFPDYFPNDFVQLVMNMIHPKSTQRPTAEAARSALEQFEDDEKQMTHFEVACRQFRQVEKRNKYEYKSIDEALVKTEVETLQLGDFTNIILGSDILGNDLDMKFEDYKYTGGAR